jgi:hypothetical protein
MFSRRSSSEFPIEYYNRVLHAQQATRTSPWTVRQHHTLRSWVDFVLVQKALHAADLIHESATATQGISSINHIEAGGLMPVEAVHP